MKSKSIDRTFLVSIVLLIVAGFFIFSSAALGLKAREGISYSNVAIKQFVIGFVAGGIILVIASKIPFKFWRKYAFLIFLISIIGCILVFVPVIGFEHGGAKRWINLGAFTFQPAEILKLGAIVYFAAWSATIKDKIKTFKFGAMPLFVVIGIVGTLLLKQPDTGTFMVVFAGLVAVFIAAGGRWKHVFILFLICVVGVFLLAMMRPYLKSRIMTFVDPSRDSQGAGYQIQQSLIAIGSGGILGRGFGQSIQKFNFLPEPIGDSIFAVASEEFGFFGATILIVLFLFFALRGYKIAAKTHDQFGSLLAVGIITVIVSQAFINMGAMLSILPLTGVPLAFVSHGGSAMLFNLAEAGIVLNISKGQKNHRN
jgi:cell division protein FtsW